jgi:hypothetical protein
MKTVKTFDPYISDDGEADMQQRELGSYVHYSEYMKLYKKYIRARATVNKNKIKATLKAKEF